MKVRETKQHTGLGGGGMVSVTLVRILDLPDGTKLADGQTKVPDEVEVHDWKQEEAN